MLAGADEALLGVAFVQRRGINLLERQLTTLPAGRLLSTTVFGSTTSDGLATAQGHGLGVRVLNPARGTFHPKLYLARRGERIAAAVGSANLTSGLIANIEVVAVLDGPASAPPLRALYLGESWWAHPDAVDWSPLRVPTRAEVLQRQLREMITAAVAVDPLFPTVSDAKPNIVHEVTPDGVWVETLESRAKGHPPQLVPAWMIQVAWDFLQARGSLTHRYLLADDGLNVKRSAFVCALLARLPGVDVASPRPIELRVRVARAPAE